jgi:hypothetical protein
MLDFKALAAEFPKEAISWRAQSVSGERALALAYIDARDVMDRLDTVCGMGGWQARYPHANGKTCCEIGIKVGDEWVWKANGAGDSDVEAEKGAFSDAFKRAAVMWGIGRYLYDDRFKGVWAACELNSNGKWKAWKESPWNKVKAGAPVAINVSEIENLIKTVDSEAGLVDIWTKYKPELYTLKTTDKPSYDKLEWAKNTRKIILTKGDNNVVAQ